MFEVLREFFVIGGASCAERLFRIPIGTKAPAALVRDGL